MTKGMQDVSVILDDRPGALADFGQVLGAAGVSLEGGGVFTHDSTAIAHFLVDDGAPARLALENVGIGPVAVSAAITLRLDQGRPGQLGLFARRLGDAAINIRVQYSDHDHRLALVVDEADRDACAAIAAEWDTERPSIG